MNYKLRKIIFFAFLCFGIFSLAEYSLAANWYVEKNASGSNNGTSWANAWNELNQIQWSAVNPGDVVYIGGGTYTTRLTMSKAGNSEERINVQKAIESGHDSKVVIPGVTISATYNTLDGIDRNLFSIIGASLSGVLIDINTGVPSDFFELKHAYVKGIPANQTGTSRMLRISSGSLFIDGCEFYGIHGAEDQLIMTSPGNGESLRIENSIFRHWPSMYIANASWSPPWSHSDMFQDYCGTYDCYRGDLIFKYNLVDDSGINTETEVYKLDVFMNAYTHYNNVDVEYNIFKSASDVVKIKSAQSVRITNNVFTDIGLRDFVCTTCNSLNIANNIYLNTIRSASPQTNSIWAPGTIGYMAGTGNIQADPLFINSNSLFGADDIPFTNDDGFNISASSPAINAGATIGQTRDIIGNAMSNAPDIGAYEYQSGGPSAYCGDGSCNNSETCSSCSSDCGACPDTTPPAAPSGLVIQ